MPLNHYRLPVLAASVAVAGLLGACKKPADAAKGPPKVPVLAAQVVTKDVPLIVSAIGAVQPPASVTVKAQVSGQIAEVHFKEGQDVKKGDKLFTIDKRPFEVSLAQAQAALEQAQAQAANAQDQAERYKALSKTGAVATEQFEQIKTTLRTTKAAVESAEAQVRSAQLQLEYCEVTAPLEGRTGKYLIDPGNVIQASMADLVVINQINPIEVTFAVAERYLSEIARYQAEGSLKVVVTPDTQERKAVEGELIFLDNAVKSTTGTIELKALFKNDPRVLWPGQFVDAELYLTTERNVVTAPASAVQNGQIGSFIYVIKPDQTVEARPVIVSRVSQNDAVIREGLKGGEQIVLDGQSRLGPGAKVDIKPALVSDPISEQGKKAALTRLP